MVEIAWSAGIIKILNFVWITQTFLEFLRYFSWSLQINESSVIALGERSAIKLLISFILLGKNKL